MQTPIDPHQPLDYPEPMKVSAQYAETHFAALLGTAKAGEQVEIDGPDASFCLTVVKPAPKTPSGRPRRELLGAWEGQVNAPSQAEWTALKEEFAAHLPDVSRLSDPTA